jgi:hypothetical protein
MKIGRMEYRNSTETQWFTAYITENNEEMQTEHVHQSLLTGNGYTTFESSERNEVTRNIHSEFFPYSMTGFQNKVSAILQ